MGYQTSCVAFGFPKLMACLFITQIFLVKETPKPARRWANSNRQKPFLKKTCPPHQLMFKFTQPIRSKQANRQSKNQQYQTDWKRPCLHSLPPKRALYYIGLSSIFSSTQSLSYLVITPLKKTSDSTVKGRYQYRKCTIWSM